MEVSRIPAPIAKAALTLLQPYVRELTSGELLAEALREYCPSGKKPPSASSEPGKLLSVATFARRCNCSERKIWHMLSRGELPRVKLGPRITRIPEAALLDLTGGR